MSRVDAEGVGIEYEISREGRPVVLLHGFPDSGRLWRHHVPALTAAGFQVIGRTCAVTAAQTNPRRWRIIHCCCWPGTCWRYRQPSRSNAPTWSDTTGGPLWPGYSPPRRITSITRWPCRSGTLRPSCARLNSASCRGTCCSSSSQASASAGSARTTGRASAAWPGTRTLTR